MVIFGDTASQEYAMFWFRVKGVVLRRCGKADAGVFGFWLVKMLSFIQGVTKLLR